MNHYTGPNSSINVLPISLCNAGIGLYDHSSSVPKKLSSLKSFRTLLPDPAVMRTGHLKDPKVKKAAKSFCSLNHLLREAHKVSASASATCSSSPKLGQQRSCRPESRNTSMRNAVFDVHQTSRRRRPQVVRARNCVSSRLIRNELLLDDCGSLLRRMEEYKRQKKSKSFTGTPSFLDTDSDDEDLE